MELVILIYDDGYELLIHAMKAPPSVSELLRYLVLLGELNSTFLRRKRQ